MEHYQPNIKAANMLSSRGLAVFLRFSGNIHWASHQLLSPLLPSFGTITAILAGNDLAVDISFLGNETHENLLAREKSTIY